MAPIQFPVTVRADGAAVDLTVSVASGMPFRRIRNEVTLAAGLADGTPLFHGVGPVMDEWLVGAPPLVAGCILAGSPSDGLCEQPAVTVSVVAGPDAGRYVPLGSSPIRVGRHRRTDLPLTDETVSLDHALLEPGARGVMVTDLDSTNGVFVDGIAVSGSAPATTGATIRLGNTVLRIELATSDVTGFRPDNDGYLTRAQRVVRPRHGPPELPPKPAEPATRQRRALPLASLAVGIAVGGGLALLLDQMMFLAFAAFGPLTMAATAVSDRLRGRRSQRKERAAYRASVKQWDIDITAILAAERQRCWRIWAGPVELLRRARFASGQLWDRPPSDPTFLIVAIATGTRAPYADRDTLELADVPLTTKLAGVIPLSGPSGRGLARWLLMQLAALHSPSDVAVLLIGAASDLNPCRNLPHTIAAMPADDTTRGRVWGDDDEVLERMADAGRAGRSIVVVLDGERARSCSLGRTLLRAATADGSVAREGTETRTASWPWRPQCVLCVGQERSAADDVAPAATAVDAATLAAMCQALAPLREAATTGDVAACPDDVDLPSVAGPIAPQSIRERWQRTEHGALLGVGADGPVRFDLDADGPHLLIAGTTGSGKSELLRTLVAGLAVAQPPQHLTFLLVDYKGGTAFGSLATLPHVVGVVTDLSPALSARALASLRAELRAREARQADGDRPGPELVVVIDEFATLAVELPEFLSGVLDIAQRGRSLGVHLVLATQRPAGVVSPAMRANISTRICLRVTDPAESVDVIDSNDAVRISARHPGRAIMIHDGSRTLFQAAQVSVAAAPDVLVRARGGPAALQAPRPSATTILDSLIDAVTDAAAQLPPPKRPWLPPLPVTVTPDEYPEALALVDVPDEQRRELFSLPTGSMLVTGPAGSGRSTTLRTIARLAADDGDELLIVDGVGALADLRCWREVSSYLDLAEPRLVLRLLALLSTERPADGRQRCLMIDHYELVAAALERADYLAGTSALSELPSRSGRSVRLVASGPATLVQGRAAALFPNHIELGADGHSGSPIPGRGRCRGRELQIVHRPPGQPSGSDPEVDAGVTEWPDGIVVRPLPDRVLSTDLPAIADARLPIGIGGDNARPVFLDLAESRGAIVVTGPRRSGVSTALEAIGGAAACAGVPVIRIIVGRRNTPSRGATHITDVIDVQDDTEPLRARLASHSGPLVLVVDHDGVGAGHPAGPLIERYLAVCHAGQHVLIGERTETLARMGRGHLRAALGERRGLLLSPNAADGMLLDASLPQRTGGVRPGRGFWVDDAAAVPLQVAVPARCGGSHESLVDTSPINR